MIKVGYRHATRCDFRQSLLLLSCWLCRLLTCLLSCRLLTYCALLVTVFPARFASLVTVLPAPFAPLVTVLCAGFVSLRGFRAGLGSLRGAGLLGFSI